MLDRTVEWQDLKDACREAGRVVYVEMLGHGRAVVEYECREERDELVRRSGRRMLGRRVTIEDGGWVDPHRKQTPRSRSPRGEGPEERGKAEDIDRCERELERRWGKMEAWQV